MSSDRLSFNHNADGDDDGARWEAYLALLRRTGASPASLEDDVEVADADEPSAEPHAREPSDPIEEDETLSLMKRGERDGADGLAADEPLRLSDWLTSADAEGDATVAPPTRPLAAESFRRNSRLAIWTLVLTAGIILTALLISRPPDHRDASALSPRPPKQSGDNGLARQAAPVPSRGAPPLTAPLAPSPRHVQQMVHQARRQRPQCWTAIPSADERDGEARLTACPSLAPPPEPPGARLVWQATP